MVQKKSPKRGSKAQDPPWVRASISFPADIYKTLEMLAKEKKVSLAWVVREAAEKYIETQKHLVTEE